MKIRKVATLDMSTSGASYTTTHTTLGMRVAAKVGGRSFSIRQNNYGNWYGYVGSRRAQMFFNNGGGMEANAREWLAAQVAAAEEHTR